MSPNTRIVKVIDYNRRYLNERGREGETRMKMASAVRMDSGIIEFNGS